MKDTGRAFLLRSAGEEPAGTRLAVRCERMAGRDYLWSILLTN